MWLRKFFLTFIYFTSLREQAEAYINFSQWSTLVGLKPVYIHMWVTRCTTVIKDVLRGSLLFTSIQIIAVIILFLPAWFSHC